VLSASTHVFSELFIHINWHCQHDEPMITPAMEKRLFEFIKEYCNGNKGLLFLEVGGTETHVHLLLQMEPHLCPADFVGRIKGASSHAMNQEFGPGTLKWQRGYGIVSFAGQDLPAVRRYVQNQKEHHARATTRQKLENCGGDDEGSDAQPEEGR
jgi:REP element-mobilizing transposase RayT